MKKLKYYFYTFLLATVGLPFYLMFLLRLIETAPDFLQEINQNHNNYKAHANDTIIKSKELKALLTAILWAAIIMVLDYENVAASGAIKITLTFSVVTLVSFVAIYNIDHIFPEKK